MAEPVGRRRARVVDGDAGARVRAAVRSIGVHAQVVNRERSEQLAVAFDRAVRGGLSDHDREAAAELAHQLVGSAGTFGFATASELAADLERFFVEDACGNPLRVAAARHQVEQLRVQLAAEPSYIDRT